MHMFLYISDLDIETLADLFPFLWVEYYIFDTCRKRIKRAKTFFFFCLSIVSDGMMIFSPVTSARYRRSSVSINPSCPPQVSLSTRCDAFTALSVTLAPARHLTPFSPPPPARSPLTILGDSRQTGPEEAGENVWSFDLHKGQWCLRCFRSVFGAVCV